jgi:hypothetical protein
MLIKTAIFLLLAIGLSSNVQAATTKPAPGPALLIHVPNPTAPDAPMRTWDEYGQRWE